MAVSKRVIVLEHYGSAPLRFRYVLWADVPATRQAFYADASKVSAWKDASAADNLALQTGFVAELASEATFPPGTTVAAAKLAMQAAWQKFQDDITAANPWDRYGMFMDTSNAWINGGVV